MSDAPEFLRSLALVLCVAALTTIVFQRLRQPVVLGYLIAGMIIGPHIPIPVIADERTVHSLSELGVILLMFGLGLEFSLRKLIQVGGTAGLVAVAQSSAMVYLGYLVGQLFGWSQLESVYAGAVIAISSTTIIIKAFGEQGVGGRVRELVFGVLIMEDLIGIFLIAILTAVSSGAGLSLGSLATTAGRLATFLAGLIGIGLLIVPRLVRFVVRLNRPETTLVASVGICFAAALLALAFGYSVALGAFIAGSLVAESGEERTVEHLVAPVRDMFAAIFFVAVGMLIDPSMIVEHWPAVLALTLAVIIGKVVAVSVSAFLTGAPVRVAVQSGMSLAQIGEFSFIIASVGLSTGATRGFLYPVAIAVSAISTLTTPWLIHFSAPAASYIDRALPTPLQTFVSLYGSWLERLRSAPREEGSRSKTQRRVRVLLLDAVLVAAVVIGVSLEMARATAVLRAWTGLTDDVARLVVLALGVLVLVPLLAGIIRTARMLGHALALRAIPAAREGAVDFGAAPRRALIVTLQLGIVLAVGVPLVAMTQPFVPALRGAAVFVGVVLLLGIALWRSAADLQGHTRAGAELIVAALAQQMSKGEPAPNEHGERAPEDSRGPSLAGVHEVLPGLGEPESMRLQVGSPGVNRTLADLNLRGLTGATVLAITRDGVPVLIPTGREVLLVGDVLAIAGTTEAIRAAEEILRGEVGDAQTPERMPEQPVATGGTSP